MLDKIRKVFAVALACHRRSARDLNVYLAFALGFVATFLLTDKVVRFSERHGTSLQITEPFIWTFGDARSILLISLCLLLLFADVPKFDGATPFSLMRAGRRCYVAGQTVYVASMTALFVLFIFVSSALLSGKVSFAADMWSDTAAILGYSDVGSELTVPAFVKVLERSFPYGAALHVFLLLLGYSLVLSSVIFLFNLSQKRLGMAAGAAFSAVGAVLNPMLILEKLNISPLRLRVAKVIFGWVSPLNHATYYMHDFGYDDLPTLVTSYLIFAAAAAVIFALAVVRIGRYDFNFTGNDR